MLSITKRLGIMVEMLLLVTVLVSAVSASEGGKVSFMGPISSWGPELQEAFNLFTERTGIAVEVLNVASWVELNQKYITMSAAGEPPDLVYGDDMRIFSFAEQKMLLSLDSMIARDKINLKVYPKQVVDSLKVRGSLYSMPTAVSTYGMFYNADLFDKYGQKHLPTKWLGNEFGWDEFVSLSRKLTQDTNGDGKADLYGLQSFGSYGGVNMIGMWGAQDADEDRNKYLGTDPKVVNAMTQLAALTTQHSVIGGNWLKGTAAMYPVQTYYLNNVKAAIATGGFFSWKIGILPKGEVRSSCTSFHMIGLAAGSKNQENAWKLLRFLSYEADGSLLFTRAENRTPVMAANIRDYLKRWNETMPGSNPQVFVEAVDVLWKWRIVCGYGGTDIGNLLNSAWGKIRNGTASVLNAYLEVQPQIQAILDDARRKQI